MTGLPPPPPPPRDPGDVDEWYRRVSSSDRSRPSETVRQAVLDHAAKLAETRAAEASAASTSSRWRSSWGWRGPAVAGTLAAALAAVMLLPRVLPPPADEGVAPAPAIRPAPATQAAPSAQGEPAAQYAPTLQDAPAAPAARAAPAAPRPEAPSSITEAASRARSEADSARNVAPSLAARESRQFKPGIANRSIAAIAQTQALTTNPRGSQDTGAALRRAAEIGDLPALETLLQKRVDLDSRDSLGRTALMLATLDGQTGTVVALLAHGADPNAADARGTTPLEAARAGDHPDIAAALERYGAH